MKPQFALRRFLSIAGSSLLTVTSASATEYWWDSNNNTAGFGSTAGTWTAPTVGTTTAGWSTSSLGTNVTNAVNVTTANTDDLNFGTAASAFTSAITVSSGMVASSLQFGSANGATNFSLSGGSLTLGGTGTRTGILINSGVTGSNGVAATISGTVALNGNQNWTNNGTGALVFSNATTSVLTGTANLGIDGTGRISITGLAGGTGYSGNITVSGGGELESRTNITATNGVLGTGNINVTSGIVGLYFGNTLTRAIGTGAGQIQFSGGVSGISGNGGSGSTFTISGMTWGTTAFNPTEFILQNATANTNGAGTLAGNIDLQNGGVGTVNRTIRSNQTGGILAGGTGTFTGNITNTTGTAELIKVGIGRHVLTGANSYNGGTTISEGTLQFGNITAMPSSGAVAVSSGATIGIDLGAAGDWTTGTSGVGTLGGLVAGFGGAGSSTVTYAGDVGLLLNVAAVSSYAGVIANPTGTTSLALTKIGGNALTLTNSNSYTGGTNVFVNTLNLGHATNTLADTGAVNVNGGTLALGTNSDTVGAVTLVTGTISSGTGVLTASSINAQSGTISAKLGGTGTLTKNTSGTVTLSGANNATFSGDVILNAGTIDGIASGAYQGFGTGLVSVNAGTLLISAGNTPTIANNLKFNGGSVLTLTRSAGTTPTLTFTGNVELAGNGTVTSGVSTTSVNSVFSGNISDPLGNFTLTLNGTSFGQTFTFSGDNSAWSGGLNMSSGAILNLDSANASGTGILTITAGTTNIRHASFGSGALNLGGGTIDNNSGGAIVLTNNNVFNFNANTIFTGTRDLSNGTGNFTINGTRTITVNGSKLTLGGNQTTVVAGGILKAGAGTLALLGTGAHTGASTISAGVLEVGVMTDGSVASSLGSGTGVAANLLFTGGVATNVLRYVGSANAITNRAFTTSNGSIGGATIESSGQGTLTFTSTNALSYGTGNETRQIILGGTNTGANTFGKVIANNTALTSLTKSGVGKWIVNAANTYTGKTTVNEGTLQFAKMVSLNNNLDTNWTAAKINVKSAATLAVNVDSVGTNGFTAAKLNTLLTNISVANIAAEGLQAGAILGFDTSTANLGTFTQGNAIADSTGSGAFHGAIGVTKLGTGTLVLDKTNTYTGATTVSAGKLVVDGNISTSVTTVAVGATLAGIGTVGATTVLGTLAIGNSPGTMSLASLNLGAASTFLYEMTGGVAPGLGSADLGDISGALTIDTSAVLDLVELGTYTPGNKFTLFAYDGLLTGNFSGLLDGATFTDDLLNSWTINYDDGTAGMNGGVSASSTYVTISAIPEPNVAALIGGFGILALLRRRR